MIDTDFVPRQIESEGGPDLVEIVDLLMELHRRLDRIEGLLRTRSIEPERRVTRLRSSDIAKPYLIQE